MNWLKISYIVCGIYDLTLALGVFFLRSLIISLFDLKTPNPMLFVDLIAYFLFGFGILLVNESRAIEPRLSIGLASTGVRLIYFLSVCYYVFFASLETFYVITGITDLITGLFLISGIIIYVKENPKLTK